MEKDRSLILGHRRGKLSSGTTYLESSGTARKNSSRTDQWGKKKLDRSSQRGVDRGLRERRLGPSGTGWQASEGKRS